MKKIILPILLILGTTLPLEAGAFTILLPSEASAYTIYVDPDLGSDREWCGSAGGPWACQTIQYAFDNYATEGSTIQLAPGIYNENLVIDTRINLEGTGSGNDPNVDSIITSAAASTNVIRLTTGGSSATDRMVIRNLRVTGGTGGANMGNGINISSGSYMTFENVASVGNDGNGIAFNAGGDQTDFVVSSCNLSNNHGGTGFRVPTSASVDGLSITDSTMNGNGVIGMSMYGSVTDLFISGSVFNDNYLVGIYGTIHRYFATKKSAVIEGTSTNGNGRGIALRIYGGSLTITNSTASNNNRANAGDVGQGLDLSVRDADATIVLSSVTARNNEDVNIFLETKSGGSLISASFDDIIATGSNDEPTAPFCDGCGIWLHSLGTAPLSNVSITNSAITGNNRGIILEAETQPLTNISLIGNDIQDNQPFAGIDISVDAASGNQANDNVIVGNGMGVDNHDTSYTFDATYNWWGDASGPYHSGTNPFGLGDEVSDNVAYDPWATIYDDPLIFQDGFESGNTSAWSSSVP
ncbi:MAG: right-handed parallel beta-helix repeat-containing protein [Thermoanaerobaculia bacterium]